MRITIENSKLKAEFESFGAELKSLIAKDSGQEYMWEADPAYWGKTSPVLFPFIGKLESAGFRYENQFYNMDKHGFARDMEFTITQQKSDAVSFSITSNEHTMVKYPFPFRLTISYELTDASLQERFTVENLGENTMYFSLGGHPAFACPQIINGLRTGSRNDASVILHGAEDKNSVSATVIGVPDGFLTGESYTVSLENGIFRVQEHTFDQDAVVIEDQGVTAVGLINKDGKEYIRMTSDCPVWGIWSMPDNGANYICIEPWWGICDAAGYKGNIQERPYTNALPAGDMWVHKLTIAMM